MCFYMVNNKHRLNILNRYRCVAVMYAAMSREKSSLNTKELNLLDYTMHVYIYLTISHSYNHAVCFAHAQNVSL